MPFYDFQCANNHRFELKQSFNAAPSAICPTCTKPARRLISLVPVHFKGSGFYVNDYGRKDPAGDGEKKSETGDGKSATGEKAAAGDKTAAKSPEAAKASEPAKSSETSKESAPAAAAAK